jgi:hypothetical protein
MNRIKDYLGHLVEPEFPRPSGPFSDGEAMMMLGYYRADPSNVPCPKCGPETIEVLAFIEPVIDDQGFANVKDPEGDYAAALYCHKCKRAVGILAGLV